MKKIIAASFILLSSAACGSYHQMNAVTASTAALRASQPTVNEDSFALPTYMPDREGGVESPSSSYVTPLYYHGNVSELNLQKYYYPLYFYNSEEGEAGETRKQ